MYFKRHGDLTKILKYIFFNQRCYFSVKDFFFFCKLTSFLNYYHYVIVVVVFKYFTFLTRY